MTRHVSTTAPGSRLEHFPVAFFAMIMGTLGLVIAIQKAAHILPALAPVATALLAIAVILFSLFLVLQALKALRFPAAVKGDFAHPVRLHFVPTLTVSLILLSIAFLDISHDVAGLLFLVGAPLHLVLTLYVLNEWFNKEHFQTTHLNPAWFIPIVGNILVPIPGMTLGFVQLSWFFFSIGIVFWIVLFAIILNRILFHQPLAERLAPTLFIMIAPPAVGFISYLKLEGAIDPFSRVLYGIAAFLTLFLATQTRRLLRLRFYLSWWAYSFPLAAMTIATFAMGEKTQETGFITAGFALLALLAILVAGLLVRTSLAVARREICLSE